MLSLVPGGLEKMENDEIPLGKGSVQFPWLLYRHYGGSVSLALGSPTGSVAAITADPAKYFKDQIPRLKKFGRGWMDWYAEKTYIFYETNLLPCKVLPLFTCLPANVCCASMKCNFRTFLKAVRE